MQTLTNRLRVRGKLRFLVLPVAVLVVVALAGPMSPSVRPLGRLHLLAEPASAALRRATPGVPVCGTPMNTINGGSPLQMICWVSGNSGVGGDQKWFYVKFQAGQLRGFVSAPTVDGQTSTPNCYWQKDTALMSIALNLTGQVYASGAIAAYFGAYEWAPGPVNEWAGDCPKLPYATYQGLGRPSSKGTRSTTTTPTSTPG